MRDKEYCGGALSHWLSNKLGKVNHIIPCLSHSGNSTMLKKFLQKQKKQTESFRVMDKTDLELFDSKIKKYLAEWCVDRAKMSFEDPRMSDEGMKCPQGYHAVMILTKEQREAFLMDQGAINRNGSIIGQRVGGEWQLPFLFHKLEDQIGQWESWKGKRQYAQMKQLEGYEERAGEKSI